MKVLKKLTTAAVLAAVCTSTLAGCGSSSTVNGGADTTAAKTEQTEKVKEESGVEETAGCEFPYKSRVMGTSEPLKPLKAPYMARNPVKWGFFRLKGQEIPLKI